MLYDAIVTTVDGNHTYKNIEALDEEHLINKIAKDLQTEIVEIEIKATFLERNLIMTKVIVYNKATCGECVSVKEEGLK